MASPVTMSTFTRSFSTSCQTLWGSKRLTRITLLPMKLPPITAHWVAPCMSGAMGSEVTGPARPFSTISSGLTTRSLDRGSMPPPRAKNTSSWRQTTPLGMPVVPPV